MRTATVILEAWEGVKSRGPGWYWMGHMMRHGDLYIASGFARAFKEIHGTALPIHLVVSDPHIATVAAIYADLFASVIIEPVLALSKDAWVDFYRETELPLFGPDTPIVLHPFSNPEIYALGLFSIENEITWAQFYKHVLRLPADVEPSPPPRDASTEQAARALCRRHDVRPGRTVLLFPYAQSFPVDALGPFTLLAETLHAQGFEVLTSVSRDEQPIPGTRPIFIPFPVLIDVAEQCGWAVAIRSGICDILSSAKCRKTVIFRHRREHINWSLARLGLCQDAFEILCFAGVQGEAGLCEQILSDQPPAILALRRSGLSDLLTAGPESAQTVTIDFAQVQRAAQPTAHEATRTPPRPSAHDVVRLVHLPPRDHPRWGLLARRTIASFVPVSLADDVRIYACRDNGELDFFEETDREAVINGRYRAGRYNHSLLVVRGPRLEERLPLAARDHVLPIEPAPFVVQFDATYAGGTPSHLAHLNGGRPISIGGLHLMENWYEPEAWGLWTSGCLSSFRFAFAEPPEGPIKLVFHFSLAVSPSFPALSFAIRINGEVLGRFQVDVDTVRSEFEVHIPLALAVQSRIFWGTLEIGQVLSPMDQGLGDDGRAIGLGLRRLEVEPLWTSAVPHRLVDAVPADTAA